eukprot:gene16842-22327_t
MIVESLTFSSIAQNYNNRKDLPNLFGINPVEAAAIGFVLYYIYGPEVLYDYARQAGKFVSTYLPIIQGVAGDIVDEFKEYFNEEKERDLLRQQGFDVSNLPRRTSNVIERLQKAVESMSESSESLSEGGLTIEEQDDEESLSTRVVLPVDPVTKQRKKKRQVLRTDELEDVARAAERASKGDSSEEIAESIEKMKSQFSQLQERTKKFSPKNDDFYDSYPYEEPSYVNESPAIPPGISDPFLLNTIDEPPPLTRFQMQMSGDWNQRVLAKESQIPNNNEITSDIPLEITANDTPFSNDIIKIVESSDDIKDDIIKILDNDYLALRNKLVSLIQLKSTNKINDLSVYITDNLKTNDNNDDTVYIADNLKTNDKNVQDINKPGELTNNKNIRKYWPPSTSKFIV